MLTLCWVREVSETWSKVKKGTREGYVLCTWLKWRCHWVITSATEVQRLCQNEFGKPTPVRPASALMHSNVLWIGANLNHGMLWKVGRLECSGKGSKPQSHVFTQSPFKKMWANNHVVAGLVGGPKKLHFITFLRFVRCGTWHIYLFCLNQTNKQIVLTIIPA